MGRVEGAESGVVSGVGYEDEEGIETWRSATAAEVDEAEDDDDLDDVAAKMALGPCSDRS